MEEALKAVAPADHSSGALAWVLSVGAFGLLAWLIKYLVGTMKTGQDAMVSELRGVRDAVVAIPSAIRDAVRDSLRDHGAPR